MKLLEAVHLTRDSWAKEFPWQAVTWEKTALLVLKKRDVQTQVESLVSDFTQEFIRQRLSDEATRADIDKETQDIRSEIQREENQFKKSVQGNSDELKKLFEKERSIYKKDLEKNNIP